MDKKLKLFLIIGVLLVITIGIWGIFFNYGYVVIQSDLQDYQAKVGKTTYRCSNECRIKLKPNGFDLTISKDGYTSMESRIYLIRGEEEKLSFDPVKVPTFTLLKNAATYQSYTFTTSNLGQVFNLNANPIVTFKDPLKTPKASIDPEEKFALIWSEDNLTEIYLIDITKETKQKTTLDLVTPLNFQILNGEKYLIETLESTYLYNVKTNTVVNFPVNSTAHVLPLSDNQILLLSSQKLDKGNVINADTIGKITDLLDAVQTPEKLSLKTPPNKIYLYDLKESKFTFLSSIPTEMQEPFSFNQAMSDGQIVPVFTDKTKTYQVKVD